jgi:hypothetical protein
MMSSELEVLRTVTVSPQPRPRLLFGAADVPALRDAAAAVPGMLERARARAAQAMATPGAQVDVLQPYRSGSEGVFVA